MDLKENLKAIFDEMEDFLTTKAVVGEAIEVGDVTLIPVINVTFGIGTGAGGGEDSKNASRQGGGAGLGAKISPTAVIVVKEGNISVVPLNGTGGVERLIDMIPDIVNKIKSKTAAKKNNNDKDRDKEKLRVR